VRVTTRERQAIRAMLKAIKRHWPDAPAPVLDAADALARATVEAVPETRKAGLPAAFPAASGGSPYTSRVVAKRCQCGHPRTRHRAEGEDLAGFCRDCGCVAYAYSEHETRKRRC
jgi:hypothetical protein